MAPRAEMGHPPDDVLFHAIHEPTWASAEVMAHLPRCEPCRIRQLHLAADDVEVGVLLGALDHPVPGYSAHEIVARQPNHLRRRAVLVAEIMFFVAAAAAAMTIPASPLHRWIVGQTRPRAVSSVVAVPEAAQSQATRSAPIGIALPAPTSLRVEFRQAQQTGTLEVHLVEGDQVTVRSRGGSVAFTVNEGRVLVDNRVPADEYIVEIPATLGSVRISVGTRVLFQKDGDHSGPVQPFEGARYRIPLTTAAPRSHP
jgi:hypothetical protein